MEVMALYQVVYEQATGWKINELNATHEIQPTRSTAEDVDGRTTTDGFYTFLNVGKKMSFFLVF